VFFFSLPSLIVFFFSFVWKPRETFSRNSFLPSFFFFSPNLFLSLFPPSLLIILSARLTHHSFSSTPPVGKIFPWEVYHFLLLLFFPSSLQSGRGKTASSPFLFSLPPVSSSPPLSDALSLVKEVNHRPRTSAVYTSPPPSFFPPRLPMGGSGFISRKEKGKS